MYLSRLILNPRSRQVRSELADLYEMHRTVMQSFAGRLEDDELVLFRAVVVCLRRCRPVQDRIDHPDGLRDDRPIPRQTGALRARCLP